MNLHYWNRYLKFIEWCDQTQIWIGETYTEKHHIMPRCFDGDNSKDNLIKLPYRAHLLAHYLLYKAIRCRETSFAFNAMVSTPSSFRFEKINNRTLEVCRVGFRVFNSQQTKALWQTKEYRDKLVGKSRKSETRSDTYKVLWKDEEYRNMQKEARKNSWNEERKIKQSKLVTEMNNERWSDSENKKKQSEACRKGQANRSQKSKDESIRKFKETFSRKSKNEKKAHSIKSKISRWQKWLDQGFSVSRHGKHPLSDEKRALISDKIEKCKAKLQS